jgi:hypothetical protein
MRQNPETRTRLVRGLLMVALCLMLASCLGVSRNPDRVTAASDDWGVDLQLDEQRRPSRIYVEGPAGTTIPGRWIVETGQTSEVPPRQYIAVRRVP